VETATCVQIYTMQSVAEAEAVAALGVDHVGVTPSDRGLPGEITESVAADICAALAGVATSVAISVDDDPAEVERMVGAVRPEILHLCGPPDALGPDAVADLARTLPQVAIMQAIAVTGPEAVDNAQRYAAVADYLILDSVTPDVPGVGAAGIVHDWEISAAIVAAVDIPVVLAGGLSPDNLVAAIEAVRPWGVDSLTCTNHPLEGGGFRKDLNLVGRFTAAARGEAAP
jgi:phosphoribosylanthranilate isomerase